MEDPCPSKKPTPPHGLLVGQKLSLSAEEMERTSLEEARAFYGQLAQELPDAGVNWPLRLAEIERALNGTGSYVKTSAELAYAARVAWRNNIRCIGRLQWRSLKVRDMRHIERADDLFEALVEHLREATNGGAILPLMSVFSRERAQGKCLKILNYQLVRYAGYRPSSGEILGDPHSAPLTQLALELGWEPPSKRSRFDLLPLLIQNQVGKISIFELPKQPEVVLEVPIRHPELTWFEQLGLQWYAVPAICNMALDAGGLKYPTTAFNGWYMGTEIASRNLGDAERYNMLPRIGEMMGLDTSNDRSLWKDKALVELNIAVLDSFERQGVRIVDHHTATKQFMDFEQREIQEGRRVCGDWAWLVPPLSGSACPVFHRSYSEDVEKPGLFYRSAFPADRALTPHDTART
jgi:nitric-oxide synthase